MKSHPLGALLLILPLTAFACSRVARDYQPTSGAGGGSTTTASGHGGKGAGEGGTSSSNSANGGSGGSASTGGGGNGGSGGSGGSISQMTACADFASAICAGYEQCAPDIVTGVYGDTATCQTRYALFCSIILGAPGTAWTPEQYEKCGAALAGDACQDFLLAPFTGGPADCQPKAGKKKNSSPCIDSGQCESAYCRHLNGAQCGTCVDRGMPGDACATVTDCKNGLKCTSNSVCAAAVVPGGMCTDTSFCQFGFACNPVSMKCELPSEANGECDQGHICNPLEGLYCDGSSCAHAMYVTSGMCGLEGNVIVDCAASGDCVTQAHECLAFAPDGASCGTTDAAHCMSPAACVSGICTIANQSSCTN